jgi:hypothetical protein
MKKIDRKELLKFLDNVSEDVIITIAEKSSDIPKEFLYNAERITLKKRIIYFLRDPKKIIYSVFVLWITALTLAPEWTPTLPKVVSVVYEEACNYYQDIDFSFPYPTDDKIEMVAFHDMTPKGERLVGSTYSVPITGFSLTTRTEFLS